MDRVDNDVQMEGCWEDQSSAPFEHVSFTASADVHNVLLTHKCFPM